MKLYFLLFSALLWCLPYTVDARPVSYPSGITAMSMNNGDVHSLHMHYSPTAHYSIGPRIEYRRGAKYTMTSLQLNNLIKRWNETDSQANFYVKSGVGWADSNSGLNQGENSLAAFTGIATDWETRRYFISYENRYIEAGNVDNRFIQRARIGITPYIGDYGDLHTWLMVEVEHEPEDEDNFTVTPLIRFFKGVHLIEAGISDDNDILFNYVIRY